MKPFFCDGVDSIKTQSSVVSLAGLLKLFALILAAVMLFGAGSIAYAISSEDSASSEAESTVNASDDADYIEVSGSIDFDWSQLPDSDELAEGFVNEAFYGDDGISLMADYGESSLGGDSLVLYRELRTFISELANNGGSPTYTFTWNHSFDATTSDFTQELNELTDGVLYTLLVDCPYDLYWFDKTSGVSYQMSGRTGYLRTVTITFAVSDDYADSNGVDATKAKATASAVEKANSIVENHSSEAVQTCLTSYRDEICSLVSYNYDAASSSYSGGYGDPWQLVYVFDGDTSTNVVCEGYSKAFQYLCDLTWPDGDGYYEPVSYIVTGYMSGGAHMWNVLRYADESFFVDVTNSDAGAIGQSGGLFLEAAPGSYTSASGYTFTVSRTAISYVYDSKTLSLYDSTASSLSKYLELAATGTEFPSAPKITFTDATVAFSDLETIFTYTGSAITPSVTVSIGSITFTEGEDYTVSYSNNLNAGTATVVVTGIGDYTGTIEKTFTIQPASLSEASVTFDSDEYGYTGTPVQPEPVVVLGGSTLVKDVDYTLSYASNTSPGTGTVTVEGKGNYSGSVSAEFSIRNHIVSTPVAASDLVYNGSEYVGVPAGTGYTLTGTSSAVDAGSYTCTAKLNSGYVWSDGTTEDIEISWTIAPKPVVVPTAASGLTYTGSTQLGVSAGEGYTLSGVYAAVNAGDYVAVALLDSNYAWSDGSIKDIEIPWTIAPKSVTMPIAVNGLTYTGSMQSGVPDGEGYTLSGTYEATDAGEYTAVASLELNYAWTDGTAVDIEIPWTIAPKSAAIPVAVTGLTYTGAMQSGVAAGEGYTLSGIYEATDAGDYVALASLDSNYVWSDGSTDPIEIPWSIDISFVELSGKGRYDTMLSVVSAAYEGSSSDYAVLATGSNFPDALAAASLAGVYNAPVVTVSDNDIDQAATAINAVGAKTVFVVGGQAAVSDSAISQLRAATGAAFERVNGASRQATAIEVARAASSVSKSSTAVVARGDGFADALSISPYAYATGSPIFLTGGNGAASSDLSEETLAAIVEGGYSKVIIVGGEAAVSPSAASALSAAFGADSVTRLFGDTRYETSAAIASFAISEGVLGYDGAAMATGYNFPDALAGGALCGRSGSVLLLVGQEGENSAVLSLLSNASGVSRAYFLGGENAISSAVRFEVALALGV